MARRLLRHPWSALRQIRSTGCKRTSREPVLQRITVPTNGRFPDTTIAMQIRGIGMPRVQVFGTIVVPLQLPSRIPRKERNAIAGLGVAAVC